MQALEQRFELVDVETISPHPANPRKGNVEVIRDSIEAHGFFGACVVQTSTRHILIGNHRWLAAKEAGQKQVPVLWVDVNDEQAKRILVADNRTAELAKWDSEALGAMLSELAVTETGLDGLAFDLDDLAAMMGADDVDGEYDPDEANQPPSVVMADPTHQVKHGEVYWLGPHVLVIANVTDEWQQWISYLQSRSEREPVFCPHPSPYMPLSSLAKSRPLVMVTSSKYLAGHVLDKWEAAGHSIDRAAA